MTKRERHEIARVLDFIIKDDCDEIRKEYIKCYGTLKGFRSYLRDELITFWIDFNPYLEKHYLDYCWINVGNRIINVDDAWCFIRDGLKMKIND